MLQHKWSKRFHNLSAFHKLKVLKFIIDFLMHQIYLCKRNLYTN